MLGRLQRTSRLDVGLALGFCGAAYLVWALVAGFSREMVAAMLRATAGSDTPMVTETVRLIFVNFGIMIDLVGLVWLVGSLLLVLRAARQSASISWAFVSAICQTLVAALGAVLVGWGINAPYYINTTADGQTGKLGTLNTISLATTVTIAVTVWVVALIWMLIERARFRTRKPSLRDGLRSSFIFSRRRA
jgi:hypothetical protein